MLILFFFFPAALHKSFEKLTSENITEYFVETLCITYGQISLTWNLKANSAS